MMKLKKQKLIALMMALMLAVSLGGCGLSDKIMGDKDKESSSETESQENDPGYPVFEAGATLTRRPETVVSLAPSLTEKLYDLGMETRLVGVSNHCNFPQEISSLPHCGTAKLPRLQRIEDLAPGLILTETALPDDAMAALDELGIPVAVLPRSESVDALMETYLVLARLMDGDGTGYEIGDNLVAEYRGRLSSLSRTLSAYTEEHGRKKALYLRLLDFTVATGDTLENQLMGMICLDNVAAGYSDWNLPEEAAKGNPDFTGVDILYMDEKYVTIKDLEGNPFYKGLSATIHDRYLYINSLAVERQSFRTLDVLEAMAAYAYPEADIAASQDETPPGEDQEMLDALDDMP